MGVRVIEAGNDGAAARIDDFRGDERNRFKFAAQARPNDLVAGNCDRLGAWGLGSSVMILAFSMIMSALAVCA